MVVLLTMSQNKSTCDSPCSAQSVPQGQVAIELQPESHHPLTLSQLEPLEIAFRNLSFVIKTKQKEKAFFLRGKKKCQFVEKVILNKLDGVFKAGRLTAIMGPTGAGKTTLLDVLAGNLVGKGLSGQVQINGKDCSGAKIKSISGFVFQDDILLPTMTVREAIEQSAVLRLPKNVSSRERKARIDSILEILHLKNCQNTKIGSTTKRGVSGGERKRTCTAMELIANPPILFLDEPTSGLDTFTAFTVVKSLSKLAKQGRTIIATIHQPSSEVFHLFDDLLILAQGNVIFYGEVEDSMEYFSRLGYPVPEHTNPADFYFMQVLRQFEIKNLEKLSLRKTSILTTQKEEETCQENSTNGQTDQKSADELMPRKLRIDKFIEAWNTSDDRSKMLVHIESTQKVGVTVGALRKMAPFWIQLTFLIKRVSKDAVRNKLILLVQFVKTIFLGVFVGLVFLNSNQYSINVQIRNKSGAIYFLIIAICFSSIVGVLSVFHAERPVFLREYKAGYYCITAYFLSKLIVEVPYYFIFPYITFLIAYYMIGLNPPFSSYLMSATFLAVISIVGLSLSFLIASIFDDFQTTLALTPALLFPLILVSGIFVQGDSLPDFIEWIKYVSPLYYCSAGMLEVEFNRDFPNCPPDSNCGGDLALKALGQENALPIGVNLVLELTIWLVLVFAAYMTLLLGTRVRLRSK